MIPMRQVLSRGHQFRARRFRADGFTGLSATANRRFQAGGCIGLSATAKRLPVSISPGAQLCDRAANQQASQPTSQQIKQYFCSKLKIAIAAN